MRFSSESQPIKLAEDEVCFDERRLDHKLADGSLISTLMNQLRTSWAAGVVILMQLAATSSGLRVIALEELRARYHTLWASCPAPTSVGVLYRDVYLRELEWRHHRDFIGETHRASSPVSQYRPPEQPAAQYLALVRTLCLHRQLSPRSLWVIGLPMPMRLVTDLAHFAPRWSCPAVCSPSGISQAMRAILVDWLLDVSLVYRLPSQTLHLGVAVLDHHVHAEGITLQRNDLQLVGCASLLVAANYESNYESRRDVTRISAADLAHMTDDSYSHEQVSAKAHSISQSGSVPSLTQLTPITAIAFLETVLAGVHPIVASFANYVLELALVYQCGEFAAATTAIGALLVALHWLPPDGLSSNPSAWPHFFEFYENAQLQPLRDHDGAILRGSGVLEEQLPAQMAARVRCLCRTDRLAPPDMVARSPPPAVAGAVAGSPRVHARPLRRSPRGHGEGEHRGEAGAATPAVPATAEMDRAAGGRGHSSRCRRGSGGGDGGGGDGSSRAGSSSGGDGGGGGSSSGGGGGGGSDAAAGATSANATPSMNGASTVGPELVPLCDLEELRECVHALTVLLRRERTKPPLAAVREKFSEAQRHSVTLLATQNPECRRRGSAAALAAKARLIVDTKLGDMSQAVGRWKSAARSGHGPAANTFEDG